jgi:hypothetical protein
VTKSSRISLSVTGRAKVDIRLTPDGAGGANNNQAQIDASYVALAVGT